jgi:N-acetylglucosamine-6-phosphate deacetylase
VTDATAGAGLPERTRFSLGGMDCVVDDGVCFLADGSALAGSAARLIDLIRTLVNQIHVPLHEAIAMAGANPARAIGLQTKGKLKIGAEADLVVLSPDLRVLQTYIGGKRVFGL